MKQVTLVLGAGGPVGHAFHAGMLRALADGLEWDPRAAHRVVGTSAGAQVAALLRAGMSADDLSARVMGHAMTEAGAAVARHWTRPEQDHEELGPAPAYEPASREYLRRVLRRPWTIRPGPFFSALLPRGRVCLEPQRQGLRNLFGDEWPEEQLWITAVCLHSGERVAFGREGAPEVDVGTAVASSGSVPSISIPVAAAGRHFVDGGMASATHLDLLHDVEEDGIVVVSSPLSMIPPMRILLALEVRRLQAAGKHVITLEPTGTASAAMGWNPMDTQRAARVAEATYDEVRAALESPRLQRALTGPQRR
ncbi:MAG: hypothetical protein H6719_33510 [Sandaracinaceae bacterium]|nr:hypothetical protein [Sandaracinaceae bacterium]